MKTLSLILVCACIGLAAATTHWTLTDNEVLDHHSMSFKVALKPQNLETLDNLFWQISNPKSPLFGKFLTNEQIADLISLPDESIKEVEAHIMKESGADCEVIMRRSVHRDYLLIETCAAQAKRIFPNLQLAVYQKVGGEKKILRSRFLMDLGNNAFFLGLPEELHQHVAGIHDVTDLPIPKYHSGTGLEQGPLPAWLSTDKEFTIPEMIEYFGITFEGITEDALKADNAQVRQGVIEFDNAAYSASELASFQKKYNIPTNPLTKIIGQQKTFGGPGTEASLDVQTITGIGQKVQTWDFVFGPTASFIDVVEALMSTKGAPNVYSCSWESYENSFTQSHADAVNTAFMKLGLAGSSFFIDAGDAGASLSASCDSYNPQFPGTSAYTIAVGGTAVNASDNVERAWIHSSGGFSRLIKRPSYQDEKVAHYLANAKLPPNKNGQVYGTTGRAFPDISAIGAYEPVLANGVYEPVGGTSGSTPQFAGIICLINIHRYQNGLGPLGPLGQVFWTLEDGVGHDVTVGQSYATNRSGYCGSNYLPGFEAIEGWDPVTGVGSPRWSTLYNQLVDLKAQ